MNTWTLGQEWLEVFEISYGNSANEELVGRPIRGRREEL
jgi:hypothetical protein